MQIQWKPDLFVGKGWFLIPVFKRYLGENNRCGFYIFKKQNFHFLFENIFCFKHFLFETSFVFEIHINL